MPDPSQSIQRGRVLPPDGKLNRLRHYSARYGVIHALASYIGRFSFIFWRSLAPIVTRPYLRRWQATPGRKIINLGGGSVLHSEWLTADMDPRSDVWTDITQPLPFPDQSVDVVYLEEVIEHVTLDQGTKLLKECCRIIKPSGTLRITTPSLDYFVRMPVDDPDSVQAINDIFYLHGHRHIYSEGQMVDRLHAAGFTEVKKSSYRDASSSFGMFDSHPERFPEAPPECSQYWEATR